jgi:hypothetical protein
VNDIPNIEPPGGNDAFHDSSLLDVQVSPQLDQMRIVLSTPNSSGVERLWMVTFIGVLRVEFETAGTGTRPVGGPPLEVYSVYEEADSDERTRWINRLRQLGEPPHEADSVRHIVLASSIERGWGAREQLEGIQVVCRDVRVEPAPRDYTGGEYSRPRIEGE